ncbi:hypothetical protein A6R68_13785 [Neotoma lepida]|uniref:Uncharacterized protein n=1 Tax=Neotoma lepida TaxID=56216 RepID=A0A1A6H1Y8_NEOLE|nr:hypothetical protein A6R68_13785 [Neotoma lepida]
MGKPVSMPSWLTHCVKQLTMEKSPIKIDGDVGRATLQGALNCILPLTHRLTHLQLPLQDVYKIGGIVNIPVDQVGTGVLKPAIMITFAPVSVTAEEKSAETNQEALTEALPGDNVGFNVKNMSVKDVRHDNTAGNSIWDPPMKAAGFTAQMIDPSS